jgi:hypothetical protein
VPEGERERVPLCDLEGSGSDAVCDAVFETGEGDGEVEGVGDGTPSRIARYTL